MELIVKKSKEIIEHLTPHAISFYVSACYADMSIC